MMEAVIRSWRERTPREQILLALMLVLLAGTAIWLLVLRPLSVAIDQARERHAAAAESLAVARARADWSAAAGTSERSVPPRDVGTFLQRSASEAGFADARTARRGASVAISIPAARPQAVFGWIRRLEAQGLVVEQFDARMGGPRVLTIDAVLRPERS